SKDRVAVRNKNLSRLEEKNYSVTARDYSACLSRAGEFDIIFIDPPYAAEHGVNALKIIAQGNNLTEDGIAVFERDRSFDGEISGLELYDERKYGKTYLSFFRRA
ncbi:MAG: RsmD family RNA methyltransferase, partial [Clostridia bacterium]|nr:RsmD family RNA methyltransferase [Clostridia bacterium]